MLEVYLYKPGFMVICQDPATDNGVEVRSKVTVNYTVTDSDDRTQDTTGIVIFEYIKEEWGYQWVGKPCWDAPGLKSRLKTWEQCIYNAVIRFELHEVKEHLRRPDGTSVVDPHPE